MTERQRIDEDSQNMKAELLARLKSVVPEAFSDGQLDLERLSELAGDAVATGPERYGLTWPGKREAIAMLQAPSRATLVPERDQSINFDDARHVFIEGENLEVLKLLYKSYFGRVKLIYIDPPYNTGNDFIYHDDFSDPLAAYLRQTGQMTEGGDMTTSAPEKSGRFHSNWLSMMYPRLSMARQMLCEDGIVVVSIDDAELPNLRRLLDEVFGEEGFIAQFVWKSRKFPDSRTTTQVSVDHEYIVAYRRSSEGQFRGLDRDETKFQNPDNDVRGLWMSRSILGLATRQQRPNLHFTITDPKTGFNFDPPAETGWRYSKTRMQKLIDEERILFPTKIDGRPREKKFKDDLQNQFRALPSIIDDVHTQNGTEEIRTAFGFQAFDFPKPSELIRRFVEQLTDDNDTILDFFSGSCSTAQAVMEQNRRDGRYRNYICVQLPEACNPDSEAVARGFNTIADIGRERIRKTIAAHATEKDTLELQNGQTTGFRAFRLTTTNIRRWVGTKDMTPEGYIEQMDAFADTLLSGWQAEDVIWEVAVREGFPLTAIITPSGNAAPKGSWRVSDPDTDRAFTICLADHIDLASVKLLGLAKSDLFVCRDTAIDDTVAANLALQCTLKVL